MFAILNDLETNKCKYLLFNNSNDSEHAKWRNDTDFDLIENYTPVESNVTRSIESDVGSKYVRKAHKGQENVLLKLAII